MKRIPNSHMVWTDCAGCGTYVLATAERANYALCTPCWWELIRGSVVDAPAPPSLPRGE